MLLFKQEKEQVIWRDYTATVFWMIGKALVREEWQLPLFIDIIYPEQKDTRTAEEIKQDIIKRL